MGALLPFLASLVGAIGGFLARHASKIVSFLAIPAFVSMVISFTVWFVHFANSVYDVFVSSVHQVADKVDNGPQAFTCLFHMLGLDQWLTSVFAVLFSAGSFWVFAVANVMAYKIALKLRGIVIKAL